MIEGFVQRCFTKHNKHRYDSNVIPYPFTINPSSYPRDEYERAYKIQYGINTLIQNLAFNIDLMDSVFKQLILIKRQNLLFLVKISIYLFI